MQGQLTRLRAIEPEDEARRRRWLNDGEVTRHLTARYPTSLTGDAAAEPSPSYHGAFYAIETHDGNHIGSVGFIIVEPEDRHAVLGITIGDKAYWSRGYGTDAIMTLLRFAFDEMDLRRVSLGVDADNERGIACYRKCGFVEEARLRQERYMRGGYVDQLVMGVLRDEFDAVLAKRDAVEAVHA